MIARHLEFHRWCPRVAYWGGGRVGNSTRNFLWTPLAPAPYRSIRLQPVVGSISESGIRARGSARPSIIAVGLSSMEKRGPVLHPPIIPDIPTVVLSELFTDVSGSIVCPNCAMAYSVLAGCGSEPSRSRLENYPERTKGTLPLRRPSLGRLFHLRSIAAVKLVTVRRTAAADTSSRRVSPIPRGA